jgi:LacI family transcriptional regulator
MNKKRLTIKEFSKKLGVSTATVSRAFSTKGRISEATRDYIHDKAIELGYRANANARNLTLQRSDSIGYFYPSLIAGEPDYFIAEILMGINEAVSEFDMRLHIYPFAVTGEELSNNYKTLIFDGSLEGIIIHGGTEEAAELIELAEASETPYIAISDIDIATEKYVGFNTAIGAEKVGRFFAETRRKHPAFICGVQDERKLKGYKKGLGKLADRLLIDEGGTTFQDGYNAYERIAEIDNKIDSLFCANDILAIGFMRAAVQHGKSIPEEISVIGCDNVKFAQYHTPSLTTIRIPKYELGQKSVEKLLQSINGESATGSHDILGCELIVRESS